MAQQDHKLPTVEEFFNLKAQEKGWEDFHHYLAFDSSHSDFETKLLLEWNKEFTKLHVEAALKKANKTAQIELGHCYECGGATMLEAQNTILDAYPLENIK